MHSWGFWLGIALIVLGVGLRLVSMLLERRRVDDVLAGMRPRPRIRARQLGLGHRLAARLLHSEHRPPDADFDWLEHYTSAVDVRPIVLQAPGWSWVASAAAASEPLLEVERLLEGLEKFSARLRSWRPGRRHERS